MCVFLVTRPFTWYCNFYLDLEVLPTFEKNFNLGHGATVAEWLSS